MAKEVSGVVVVNLEEVVEVIRNATGVDMGKVEVIVATDLNDPPYPYFLEYGTSRMPAYPTARPAYVESSDAALAAVTQQLGNMVAAAAKNHTELTEEHGKAALEAGAYIIQRAWKAKLYDGSPADTKTGTYANSIKVHRVP